MSEDEPTSTPPFKLRAPGPNETLMEWRIHMLEEGYGMIGRKLDKIQALLARKDESHAVAVERCNTNARRVDGIEERINDLARTIDEAPEKSAGKLGVWLGICATALALWASLKDMVK